jgi:REP element-mobilizing transposase RayT
VADKLQFFNPYLYIRQTSNRLPHWQQSGAVYFVTFRLADALPKQLLEDWKRDRGAWLRLHPQPWLNDIELEYHERFSRKIEHWLDAGYGSCVLRRPDCRSVVESALDHFEGHQVSRLASVIMPNHVHVVFVQNPDYPIEVLLRSWKSFSARQINLLIKGSSSLWQRDYFDRLIRDENHFTNCVRYIRRNPAKAKLKSSSYFLYESDMAKQIE